MKRKEFGYESPTVQILYIRTLCLLNNTSIEETEVIGDIEDFVS